MDKNKFDHITTFLSPNVKKLFDLVKCDGNSLREEYMSLSTVFQKWKIESWKNNCYLKNKEYSEEEWYHRGLCYFANLFWDLSCCNYSECEEVDLKWTKLEQELLQVGRYLASSNDAYNYVALLKTTSLTERILNKVLLLATNNIPFLLRDLLQAPELIHLIGSAQVDFLKLFIGSVHGLNLRNIAWHGFLSCEDLLREHSIILLFILDNCGRVMCDKDLEISHFQPFSYEKVLAPFNEKMARIKLKKSDVFEIMDNSTLVLGSVLPFWKEAYNLLELRNSDCLLLLLPLIENALRLLYTEVNSCPGRILCATNSDFYITMNEIFSPWLTKVEDRFESNGSEPSELKEADKKCPLNLVPQQLGCQLTEAFYDVFHCMNGPRIRDRISHGEVLSSEVPFELIEHIFSLSLLVISCKNWRFSNEYSRFTIVCGCEKFNDKSMTNKCSLHYSSEIEKSLKSSNFSCDHHELNSLNYLIRYIGSYESVYHPAAMVKHSLERSLSLINNWEKWSRPKLDDDRIMWKDDNFIATDLKWKFFNFYYDVKSLQQMEDFKVTVSSLGLNTIFSCKLELEMHRTLQRIMTAIIKSLENIETSLSLRYTLYTSKSLRSRQRDMYFKQLYCIPNIVSYIFTIIQCVFFFLVVSNSWKYARETDVSSGKSLLKRVLKVVENLVSYTDGTANNYHEALSKLQLISFSVNDFFRENA